MRHGRTAKTRLSTSSIYMRCSIKEEKKESGTDQEKDADGKIAFCAIAMCRSQQLRTGQKDIVTAQEVMEA